MRDPHRRAALIVLLLGGATYSAWRAAHNPWFWGPTPAAPQGAFLDLQTLATTPLVANPVGGQPATYSVFGVPAPVGWLVVGALIAGVAFVLRLSALGIFALAASWMARTATVGSYSMLIDRNAAGGFSPVQENLDAYLSWVWIVMLLQLVLTVQIAYAGHVERRTALERGREPAAGVLDTFHAVSTGAVTRFARTPGKPEARR